MRRQPPPRRHLVCGLNTCAARSALKMFALLASGTLFALPAHSATLCVKPSGGSGCYPKIAAAVAAATAGDTILVSPGEYDESVVIGKSLSLIGRDPESTVIDATGLANGIFIDGIDNTGLSAVVVSGFTVENANFEGVLIANATDVVVRDNEITRNDRSLVESGSGQSSCPGIPAFETSESLDCGEGLHLTGVDHSVIAGNIIVNNAGGILISDDTGATDENLITGNIVKKNSLDCGITVASHPASNGSPASFGVFHNTISDNDSEENGLANGGGAGVGLFAAGPGNKTYSNVIANNRLIGNGLPGVTMHNHADSAALPADLNDNLIIGNFIARNHADTLDAATSGPTGINVFGAGAILGTVITQNTIRDEALDIVTNTPGDVVIHLNDLDSGGVGVANTGTGSDDATENWWGCPAGPGSKGCAQVTGSHVTSVPALRVPLTAVRKPQ
jgi:Right handed beta helix region